MPRYHQRRLEGDSKNDEDYNKVLAFQLVILIVIGLIVSAKILIYEPITSNSFFYPGLCWVTGVVGLCYLSYKNDIYATIFKILIWIEIVFNLIAPIILFVTSFVYKYIKICSDRTNCYASNTLADYVLVASFLIYGAVTILMCFILWQFKKFEVERKSHDYTAINE